MEVQLNPDYCTVKNCVNPENCVIFWMTNFLLKKNRQKLSHFEAEKSENCVDFSVKLSKNLYILGIFTWNLCLWLEILGI